jgi:hypothetical protein
MEEVAIKVGNGKISVFFVIQYVLILTWTNRLFIVDGIISLPVALAGYFILPDLPEIAKPFYLSEKVKLFLTLFNTSW